MDVRRKKTADNKVVEENDVEMQSVDNQTTKEYAIEVNIVNDNTSGHQISASEFSLSGKIGDELLQTCEQDMKETLDRPESYKFVVGSATFDDNAEYASYRLVYRFKVAMTDFDDNVTGIAEFKGICKFDESSDRVSKMYSNFQTNN